MAAKNRQASGTPATALLSKEGVEFTVHTYDHDPAAASYGHEAADAMGVEPERVFKTLVADVDGELTVAVVPVSGSLDLKALATAVGGKKAAMADPAAVTRTTGYVLGGASSCPPWSTRPRCCSTPCSARPASAGWRSSWRPRNWCG
jgi:Cys-tRNA(Pro)/Cys-tRNA(Cys) deacylase